MAKSASEIHKGNAGGDKASRKPPVVNREVNPKLVKLMMRIICILIVLFAIAMLVFVLYAQTQLTDDSNSELDSNYTYTHSN